MTSSSLAVAMQLGIWFALSNGQMQLPMRKPLAWITRALLWLMLAPNAKSSSATSRNGEKRSENWQIFAKTNVCLQAHLLRPRFDLRPLERRRGSAPPGMAPDAPNISPMPRSAQHHNEIRIARSASARRLIAAGITSP